MININARVSYSTAWAAIASAVHLLTRSLLPSSHAFLIRILLPPLSNFIRAGTHSSSLLRTWVGNANIWCFNLLKARTQPRSCSVRLFAILRQPSKLGSHAVFYSLHSLSRHSWINQVEGYHIPTRLYWYGWHCLTDIVCYQPPYTFGGLSCPQKYRLP